MTSLQAVLGIFALVGFAWAVSENRRAVRWPIVAAGIGLQFVLAISLLRVPALQGVFLALNSVMDALNNALLAGTTFVFGYLGGGTPPFESTRPELQYVFAMQSLPFLLLISALASVLFYWRVLPAAVKAMSFVLEKTLKIGGAVGLGVSANVFMGMVEAPLLVAPYIKKMGRGEIFVLMVSGMATVAGTVMVIYATILKDVVPNALGHVLTASLINAPAAVIIASLMIPPDEKKTEGEITPPQQATSTIDAITKGTESGVMLLLNITAMLIVLVAMVSLCNAVLGLLPAVGGDPLTLQRILGYVVAPVAWLIGIPWAEAVTAGGLLGTKVVLNEFIAYVDLANLPAGALGDRSRLIMSYALCGFANFGSLGIMIGGLGTMVPERRADITEMGMKSIMAGVMATCLTGAVVGIVAP
jgi:concentrative nucleoside transporter, CNT family